MRDYKLIAKRQEVEQAIAKQNAIINAIHNGDLTKAEFLTGQQLIPTNPVVEGLLRKKKNEEVNNREILKELRAIKEKPDFDYDALSRMIKYYDEAGRQAAIEPEEIQIDRGFMINLDSDFEGDDINRLESFKLLKPSDLYSPNIQDFQDKIDDNLEKAIQIREASNIKYAKKKSQPKAMLNKYINRLETIKNGLQLQQGSSIMTSMVDLVDRFKLLVGEIESGNTNKALKNELAEILQYLFRNKKLTKTQYKMFSNLIQ